MPRELPGRLYRPPKVAIMGRSALPRNSRPRPRQRNGSHMGNKDRRKEKKKPKQPKEKPKAGQAKSTGIFPPK